MKQQILESFLKLFQKKMRIISICQPHFLPWAGYFWMLKKTDEFIFLDNVQFDKRSWQQRNYIKLNKLYLHLNF